MKDPKESKTSNPPKVSAAPDVPHRRPLTRGEAKSSRRAAALFRAMSTDYLLREQFVTDPAQVMAEYISARRLSEETSDVANQLLFAVMSNPRLRAWVGHYAGQLKGSLPSRHALAIQFAQAVARHGDPLTSLALIRAASQSRDHFLAQADILRAIIAVIGGGVSSGGTEMSPGGTQMSPGTGTEMSPGALFAGTEMSPGGGTEMSPGGTGTEMSPGALFAGTEMSPGGGTEMSPGGGTEMSPGRIVESGLPGYLQVTFSALVRYANQLREAGALLSTGLEYR